MIPISWIILCFLYYNASNRMKPLVINTFLKKKVYKVFLFITNSRSVNLEITDHIMQSFFIHSSFLYLHKETNQRNCSRSLGSTASNSPVFLEKPGSLKTRFAQTVQTPFSVFSTVLGGVKWQKAVPGLLLCPYSFALSIAAVDGIRRKNCLRRSRVFFTSRQQREAQGIRRRRT